MKNIDESRPRFPFEQPDGAKKKRISSFLLVSTQDKFLVYFYVASIFLHLYKKGGTVASSFFSYYVSVCLYIFLNLKRIETSEQSAGGFFCAEETHPLDGE